MINSFDSLNNITTEEDELIIKQIRKYFEEMDLPKEDIEKRISFAIDIEKAFRNLFLLMLGADVLGQDLNDQKPEYVDVIYKKISTSMVEHGYSTDINQSGYGYIEQYTKQRCQEIVDTTVLHKADSFYLSVEHSIAIAEDETNAIANYHNEQVAISQGYTMKTWVTMRDKKVRHTHELCDGKTISIFKPYNVGNYQAMFPMDSSLGLPMKERANCRCIVEYSGKEQNNNYDYMSKKDDGQMFDLGKLASVSILFKNNIYTDNLDNDIACNYVDETVKDINSSNLVDRDIPKIIVTDFEKINPDAIAGYDKNLNVIFYNQKYDTDKKVLSYVTENEGLFANQTKYSPLLHEIGHKYYYDKIEELALKKEISYNKAELIMEDAIATYVHNYNNMGIDVLNQEISFYSGLGFLRHKYGEIIAEAYSVKSTNTYAEELINILEGL